MGWWVGVLVGGWLVRWLVGWLAGWSVARYMLGLLTWDYRAQLMEQDAELNRRLAGMSKTRRFTNVSNAALLHSQQVG